MPKKPLPPEAASADSQRRRTPPVIARATGERKVLESPTFISLYTNDTQIQMTPWDVRLIFGEVTNPPTPDDPVAVIKQVGEVRMSPQHAKRIVMVLVAQLKHYEENIGPIPLPTE